MVGRNDPHAWGPECPWGGSAHHAVRLAFLEGSEPPPGSGQAPADLNPAEPTGRRVTRLSWACSFASFVLLTLIVSWLLALHAKVVSDGSTATIPLISAPAGLLIVALAFGIATWVGDVLPSWIQSDRQPHDPSVPIRFPVDAWCTDCRRQFVDRGPRERPVPSHYLPETIGPERVAGPPAGGDEIHDLGPDRGLGAAKQATTDLN